MNTAKFSLAVLTASLAEGELAWSEFLDADSLSLGIYQVPAGTDDRASHTPHDRDEVYCVIRGIGRLTADGVEHEMTEGVVAYVKAGVEHHFHEIKADLTLLVCFAGPKSDIGAPPE